MLYASDGDDFLFGGDGNDTLNGEAGDDLMDGGAGDDYYYVDSVNDQVIEAADGGMDTISSTVTVALGAAVEQLFLREGGDIDGTGNALDNQIYGNSGGNQIFAGGGNDVVHSDDGNDFLFGEAGDDSLYGEAGDDQLDGGAGADRLAGGAGNDTYLFGRGSDIDTIFEDASAALSDKVLFGTDISTEQLWFSQTGDDLQVDLVGSTDQLTVDNWFVGEQYQIAQFVTADSDLLLNSQVQLLVNAMAAFDVPTGSELELPTNVADQIDPVIAVAWA